MSSTLANGFVIFLLAVRILTANLHSGDRRALGGKSGREPQLVNAENAVVDQYIACPP
jgi:hypothetical protein